MEDKELDDLFRQSGEHRSFPFDANAWMLMQAKLKKDKARKRYFFWLLGGLSFVIIGMSVLLTVQYSSLSETEQAKNTLQNTKKQTISQTKNSKETILNSKTNILDEKKSKIKQKINTINQSNRDYKNQFAKNNISNTNNLSQFNSNAPEVNQMLPQFIAIDSIAQNTLLDSSNILIEPKNKQTERQTFGFKGLESITINLKINDSLAIEQENFKKIAIPQNKKLSPWAFQVGVSPDLSSVKLLGSKQIGTNIGVLLEYHFAKRLSISSGAFYALKTYHANADDYKPYSGYWQSRPKPNDIQAVCDVIDIPLNIRYYASNNGKNKYFASLGLSSYWMLTEKYDYIYENPYYPTTWTKEISNENTHFFSVANFSIGLQRPLTQNWSIQVEPFVKLPLAGVGFGKIKLASSGVFLALKYRLQKKDKL